MAKKGKFVPPTEHHGDVTVRILNLSLHGRVFNSVQHCTFLVPWAPFDSLVKSTDSLLIEMYLNGDSETY